MENLGEYTPHSYSWTILSNLDSDKRETFIKEFESIKHFKISRDGPCNIGKKASYIEKRDLLVDVCLCPYSNKFAPFRGRSKKRFGLEY